MNRRVVKKLEMAQRVLDFSHAHPSADPRCRLVVDRLEGVIHRMLQLAAQQHGGYGSKKGSTLQRLALRRRLHGGLLRHLVTIAASAAAEEPTLREKFRLPPANATHQTYQSFARTLLEQGRAHEELLAGHGLSERLLEDLEAAVREFDATVADTNNALEAHIAARAELAVLAAEVTQIVAMLDGINRYRLEGEPSLLVVWESVKHLVADPHSEDKRQSPAIPSPESLPAGVHPTKPAA
ncbi:MAG TPA: hypothetical protein VFN08_19630 [Gemmatimonadales bacterium]|jgi:hypothetical protein|nr:hypothetical protein [Gemmatimonadales bacterium]